MMKSRGLAVAPIAVWLCCCPAARGDGGTVHFRGKAGEYAVTVFTAPTPLRAGPVDISVLVQDAAGKEPVPQARVNVAVAPRGRSGAAIERAATAEAATNKLLRSAVFELPGPGWWDVEVSIGEASERAQVRFPLEALEAAPTWLGQVWWLAWPVLAVAFYAIHQCLVARAGGRVGR
jgi:hypothetical protein